MAKLTKNDVKIDLDDLYNNGSFSQFFFSTNINIDNQKIKGRLNYRIHPINYICDSENLELAYKKKICFENKMCYIAEFGPYGFNKENIKKHEKKGAGRICLDFVIDDCIKKDVSLITLYTVNQRLIHSLLYKNEFNKANNESNFEISLYYRVL
jgi:hypothetical protein